MRSTLIVEVSKEMSDFIRSQQGLVDPSALINLLLRQEMEREGLKGEITGQGKAYNDEVKVAMEEFVDQATHAAD